jgi:hypothetical protein
MKTGHYATFDMETLEWLERPLSDYEGDVALAKGNAAKGDALTNAQTGQQGYGTLLGEGQADQSTLLPFLNQEITNPQGFGQQELNAMTTATGQATSGALSGAEQQAKLQGARTGNPAAQSAIIANAARTGENANSNAQLGVQEANANLKQKQQQQGEAGLQSLTGLDTNAALSDLGLSNQAIGEWSGANKSAGNLWQNALLPLIQDETQIGAAAAKGGGLG